TLSFHVKHALSDPELLLEQAGQLGVQLGAGEAKRILQFERLLMERAIPAGLVSRSDATRLRERHILDCLRATPSLDRARECYDLGSGAGLPGVLLAIALPSVRVRLVEARSRRAAFLEQAVQALGLENAVVVAGRIEDLREPADACLARAFSPLAEAWEAARPLLRPMGRLVYFAGKAPAPSEIPADAVLERLLTTPVLESAGPLVIMTRQ
ncbi:MAG: 16S rRNA (guanine(527)-N(7))-methyltransferase RsmG, partial [Vicinamibacteria bacterium]